MGVLGLPVLLRVFSPIFPAIFILLYNRCLEAVGTPTLDVHDTTCHKAPIFLSELPVAVNQEVLTPLQYACSPD